MIPPCSPPLGCRRLSGRPGLPRRCAPRRKACFPAFFTGRTRQGEMAPSPAPIARSALSAKGGPWRQEAPAEALMPAGGTAVDTACIRHDKHRPRNSRFHGQSPFPHVMQERVRPTGTRMVCGRVSRAAKGADCKSAGLRLRRFESCLSHHHWNVHHKFRCVRYGGSVWRTPAQALYSFLDASSLLSIPSRSPAHLSRASSAGQRACPQSVRLYSTLGGT
jgi:hypothetical protein